MEYYPDRWVKLRITELATGESIDKLFVGWYGGFAQGDYWKLNSGITEIKKLTDHDNVYEVFGYSGSSYIVNTNAESMSVYMQALFDNWVNTIPEYMFEVVGLLE